MSSEFKEENTTTDTSLIDEPAGWQFRLGMFISRNRVVFKRFFYFSLFLINIIILGNLGIKWVHYATETDAHIAMTKLLSTDLIDYDNFNEEIRPNDLKILKNDLVSSGQGLYDIMTRVSNNNSGWIIESIDYRFIIDGQLTEIQQTHILPNQNKLLIYFNYPSSTTPKNIKLDIVDKKWQKIKDTRRVDIYQAIQITNEKFNLADDGTGRAEWEIKNNSAYSFWSIGFQVLLYGGSHELAAVNYLQTEKIPSMAVRNYSVGWYHRLPSIFEVEIIPDVNVYQDSVFMPLDVDGIKSTKPF